MRRQLKFIAIMAAVASLHGVFVALTITATPAQASQQGQIYKDQSSAIFIYGLQPGQRIESAKDFPPARFITSNACGLLIVRRSKTQAVGRIQIEGQTINEATLTTQLLPTCKNGQLAESRTIAFKTAAGDVVLPKLPNRRYQVSMLDRRQLRASKANACGFIRFPGYALGEKPLLPTTTGSVARFAIADLPTAEQILCNRKQFYKPGSFPPPLATAMSNQTIVDEGGTASPVTPPTTPSNTPPTISDIPFQTITSTTGPDTRVVPFTVGDAETPAANLTVTVNYTPNPAIVSITPSGSGANRTLTIVANNAQISNLPVEVSVSDGTNTTTTNFSITVTGLIVMASKMYVSEDGTIEITSLSPNTFYTVYFEEPRTIRTNQCGTLTAFSWWANEARLFSGSSMEDDWSNLIRTYNQFEGNIEAGSAPSCN